jgi:hypothetical protein
MPRLVKEKPQAIYGSSPFNMNLYTMAAVERHALRDTIQEYDPHVSLNDDPLQAALVDPNHYQGAMEMDFTSGLGAINPNALRLSPSVQRQLAQQNAKVALARETAMAYGNLSGFEEELADPSYWNQTMEMGLGAISRPLPPPPQSVKMTVPEPVKTSTVYAVVGISVVAVLGSIAAWAYFSGKRK